MEISNKCPVCLGTNIKSKVVNSRTNKFLSISKCYDCFHSFQDNFEFKDIYSSGGFTSIARDNQTLPTKEITEFY